MTAPQEAFRNRRDRVLLAAAVVGVLLTSALVVFTVRKAEHDGSAALQRLQQSQVEQLARSMDTRIKTVYVQFAGILDNPQAPPWSATARNPGDLARITALSPNREARTGIVLVDTQGVVTNGTLLRDPAAIGTRLTRPGLDAVLRGAPAFLPVAPGLTTALPTVALAYPLKGVGGRRVGALLYEVEVAPTSDFNAEVSQLRSGRTGQFSFVDSKGVVVASSDASLLGRALPRQVDRGRNGFRRAHGQVSVVEPVPSAGWTAVFTQDGSEFDGALTGPLRSALLLIVLGGALAAGLSVVLLARRLRAAREEQRRLQEVSAVREEFISIVSHELRTPVAGLLGFLQTTLDHWDAMAEDERRRAIGRSLSSARRLHALTRDVLDTGSMESGGMGYSFLPTDLREEVTSAVTAAKDLLPDREIELTVPDQPVWVSCDRERITQVMTNLLDNALKSAPSSPLAVTVAQADGLGHVAVADEGPGMDEAELSRVFEKFVRGRTATPAGTGLGLYICKQIVTAHGGEIHAESDEGRGATVTFSLPLVEAPLEAVPV